MPISKSRFTVCHVIHVYQALHGSGHTDRASSVDSHLVMCYVSGEVVGTIARFLHSRPSPCAATTDVRPARN